MFGSFFKPKDLWTAAKHGDTKAIEGLVAAGHDINSKKETFRVEGDTPLHFAVRHKQKEAIKTLVKLGARINEKSKGGATPLTDAINQPKHEDIVELLLDLGAKIDAQDKLGKTALDWAAFNGSVNLVRLLISRGAKPNVGQGTKRTSPIAECARNGNIEVLGLLLKAGADLDAMRYGSHGLGTASIFGKDKFVKLLLEAGADPNLADEGGTTPLIAGVAGRKLEIVKMLVEAGAKLDAVRFGGRAETALDFAEWMNKRETKPIADYLRSVGAKSAAELPISVTTPPSDDEGDTFWQLKDDSELIAKLDPWPPQSGSAKIHVEISANDHDANMAFSGTLEYRLASIKENSEPWKPMKRGRKDEENNVSFSEAVTLPKGVTFIQFKVQPKWENEPLILADWEIEVS